MPENSFGSPPPFLHTLWPIAYGIAPQSNVVLPAPQDQPLAPATELGMFQPKLMVLLSSDGGHQTGLVFWYQYVVEVGHLAARHRDWKS
jgi:hypothetical protein